MSQSSPRSGVQDPSQLREEFPSVIAVDGPAASGKSTVGQRLAERLGYFYFDTGAMYRAVTLAALLRGVSMSDEAAISDLAETIVIDVRPPDVPDGRQYTVLLDGEDVTWDIRRPEVGLNVSQVSAYPAVRASLSAQQRRFAERGHIVMVGRDIGTVVLPDADLKIFLDATPEERARRRWLEEQARGDGRAFEEVLAEVLHRDMIDSTRQVAPMRAAADAMVVDSTGLTMEEVVDRIMELVGAPRSSKPATMEING